MRRIAPLFVLLAACGPELPFTPQPEVVRALWNPATGELPTPTDLVRNAAAGQLQLPLDDDLPAAEIEFRRYLNSLDGYPLSSTVTIPLSGPVSATALQGAFVMLNRDTGESVELKVGAVQCEGESGGTPAHRCEGEDCDESGGTPAHRCEGEDCDESGGTPAHRCRLQATAVLSETQDGLAAGQRYAYGLRGYGGGIRGANGEPVVADAAFYFVRSEEPLTDHPRAMPGETLAGKRALAERLEEARLDFIPLYDAMAQRGIPKDEVAVVSSFTTTGRPAVWYDPDRSLIPVPNGLLHDRVTDIVNLPPDEDDDETAREIKAAISEYDGATTSGAITFAATGAFDPASVNATSLRLFRVLNDGSVSEVVEIERGVLDDPTHAFVRPRTPLDHGAHYVLVGTRAMTTGQIPLEPQPIAALLRSSSPLSTDGVSNVGSLDDETAEFLERWRGTAVPVMDWLEAGGVKRTDVSMVVPIRTMTTVEAMLELRAELYENDTLTAVTNILTKTPVDRGLPFLLRDVETITTGTFTIRDYLDPTTKRWRADAPQDTLVDFVLTIPEGVAPGTPIPVVLFGHGLYTSRDLVYMVANDLAKAGFATFSFDLPYHGKRTVCLRDADCADGGVCDDLGQCSTGLAQVTLSFPGGSDGPTYPAATGSAFIEVHDIVAARDHFQQAVLDAFQALRVIRGADWASATGGWVLDADDVSYLGMSLGGILGAILAGAEPTIESFALNVPGGDFFTLFANSSAFQTAFGDILVERDAPEGSDAYFELERALRWLLDRVDPINFTGDALVPYTWIDPIDGTEKTTEPRRVMIQMAEGDLVIPNVSTRALSDASGVPIREYTPLISNHAFLFDPTSLEGARARRDVVEFLEARSR